MAEPTIDRSADTALVTVGDVTVAEYHVVSDVPASDTPKPYLHPLRTLAGTVITGFGPEDHTWHHGLQFAFPRVGEHNLWGGGTYLDPERGYHVLDDHGSIRHDSWDEGESSRVEHRLTWLGHSGEQLLSEHRSILFEVHDGEVPAWSLEFVSTLTNLTSAPLALGTPAQRGRHDGGYGGLFLRFAPNVQAEHLIGAEGEVEASGAASRTLVIQARDNNDVPLTLGLSFLDDATPGATKWLYRFAPEPFSAVGWAGAYDEGFELPIGASMRFGHRLAVFDGIVPAEVVERLL